jgi:hypothetical protein
VVSVDSLTGPTRAFVVSAALAAAWATEVSAASVVGTLYVHAFIETSVSSASMEAGGVGRWPQLAAPARVRPYYDIYFVTRWQ